MSDIDRRPNLSRSASQPATTPGTVTEWMPAAGICAMFLAFRSGGVSPRGAHPAAFRPYTTSLFGSWTMAKRSPPRPFM
jgi:hypothetical protein